jgi:hypothetical protein
VHPAEQKMGVDAEAAVDRTLRAFFSLLVLVVVAGDNYLELLLVCACGHSHRWTTWFDLP